MYLAMLASYVLWHILSCALPAFSVRSYDPFERPEVPHPLGIDSRRMFCKGDLPRGIYGDPRTAWDIITRIARPACNPDSW